MVISMTQIQTVGWSRRSILDPVRCQVDPMEFMWSFGHRSTDRWRRSGCLIKTSVKHAQFIEGRS